MFSLVDEVENFQVLYLSILGVLSVFIFSYLIQYISNFAISTTLSTISIIFLIIGLLIVSYSYEGQVTERGATIGDYTRVQGRMGNRNPSSCGKITFPVNLQKFLIAVLSGGIVGSLVRLLLY